MAKLSKALEALLNSLGKIPEGAGALQNIPANRPVNLGKFSYINPFGEIETKDPGKIDFYLYSDDPEEGLVGSKFINQTMNNELVNSLEKGNYQDSRAYMDSVQKKFEEFGATDSEADHVIDSILSNHYDVD